MGHRYAISCCVGYLADLFSLLFFAAWAYSALIAADVFSLDGTLRLVAGHAKLISEKCVPSKTGMLTVKILPAELA